MRTALKRPLALLPILFALAALAIMLISFALHGVSQRTPDEGAAAHLFQAWFVLEVLMIGFFVAKWLPKHPRQSLCILIAQILAVLAALVPVFYYHP